jgi:hypothetical protein
LGRTPAAITTRSAGIARHRRSAPPARALALDGGGLAAQQDAQAAPFQRGAQQLGGGGVELLVHQAGRHVHHRHVHPAAQQAVGRFQPEQAAADHHRAPARARRRQHGVDVVQVAKADHARQLVARHRHDEGRRAGREQQAVVGTARPERACTMRRLRSMRTTGSPACRVMPLAAYHSRVCSMMSSTVFSPASTGDSRIAVVVPVRLGAEHGDAVHVGGELQQFLDRAHAGHAVADHDQRARASIHAPTQTLPSSTRTG